MTRTQALSERDPALFAKIERQLRAGLSPRDIAASHRMRLVSVRGVAIRAGLMPWHRPPKKQP